MAKNANDTLTVEEIAKRLRIGRNQAYEAVRSGVEPSIRLGRRILVPRVAFERLLADPKSKRAA